MLEPIGRLCDRPAPTSAQDGLDPLQIALVLILVDPIVYAHIQMTCFVWCLLYVVVIVCSVPCVCVFTVRFDCDVCVGGV